MSSPLRRHAVVVGASMAGLATARSCPITSSRSPSSTATSCPTAAGPRRGVPQGRHAHALLSGGARAIAEMFPGIMEDLVGRGAALIEFNEGRWFQAGGYRASCLIERKVISASRPFIEQGVRRAGRGAAQRPHRAGRGRRDAARRRGPCHRRPGLRRLDRRTRSRPTSSSTARAVRPAAVSGWRSSGYAAPEVVDVECQMRYATVILPRRPGDLGVDFSITIESPPHGKRAAFLMPIEGDRWIATIAAGYGAAAPTDEEGFRAAAATLPAPEMDTLLARHGRPRPGGHPPAGLQQAPPLREAEGRARRVPRPRRLGVQLQPDLRAGHVERGPAGGRARRVPRRRTSNGGELVKAFYRRAAKVIATPWQIAVGADFAYPESMGPKPAGTDLVNRYMERVLTAAQVSPEVNTAMILVQNLLAPPSTLLRPSMVRTVRKANREARRRPPVLEPAR